MADGAAMSVLNPNAGSYKIRLLETNYNIQKEIIVEGEMSIGQVTLSLVDEIGKKKRKRLLCNAKVFEALQKISPSP